MKNKTLVVTAWNNKLYEEYAHVFVETYNWDFDYVVYNEDEDLFDLVPECKAFAEKHKGYRGYYTGDAVRFCYKVYAYCHAVRTYSEDYNGIIWIDADSKFHKPIDQEWIDKHIRRDDCAITYLGRGGYHSECGFMYFNLDLPRTFNFIDKMQHLYDSDKIFSLAEQHDSFVFDEVRKLYESKGVKFYDIGDSHWGHVQERSILGGIYDHFKGPERKATLGSYENPLSDSHCEIKRYNKLGIKTERRRV